MKFATTQDAQLFLVEIGELKDLQNIDESFKPSQEMIELLIKRRSNLIPGLRNFRKSQQTKQQWRSNRYKLLKGIKRFHKSTHGKRMHRAIGRFLATRDFRDNIFKRESYDNISIHEVCEILKAITSLRTHNYIEYEYYHPLEEEIQYQLFSEELINTTFKIEDALIHDKVIDAEQLDFLVRVCEPKALIIELSEALNENQEKIQEHWDKNKDDEKYEIPGGYLNLLNETKKVFQ